MTLNHQYSYIQYIQYISLGNNLYGADNFVGTQGEGGRWGEGEGEGEWDGGGGRIYEACPFPVSSPAAENQGKKVEISQPGTVLVLLNRVEY